MIHSVVINRSYKEAMVAGIQESNHYGTQANNLGNSASQNMVSQEFPQDFLLKIFNK